MTTTTIEVLVAPASHPAEPPRPAEPYRYGWRYVRRDQPDGMYVIEQVPLTLEDVLHPQEGDQVTHSDAHQRRRRYLCDVLEAQLANDPTAVVLDDVRVAWDHPNLNPHGPDIMVVLGVRVGAQCIAPLRTFDVVAEGVRPSLIIEITSPETASIDRSNKLEEYDLAGVPLYVIVDTVTVRREPSLRLLGYQQTPNGYNVLPPNERGWLWIDPAQIWLAVVENELVCYDAAGQPLGDYRALASALATEAQARAEAEQRAEVAEQRVAQLEAELRQLRGGA